MLYFVPTPIGNLSDITLRAIEVLKSVDLVLAEDTRTSKHLFDKYDIVTPLKSFHIHNEHKVLQGIIESLNAGQSMALISDAGTPGISDPGFLLARACREEGIELQVLPGPTAFVPALVVSGLPSDKFHFEGFLPHKKGRKTRLKYLASLEQTFILYVSPHRINKTLQQLIEHCGEERKASLSREISKIHEEHIKGSLKEIFEKIETRTKLKGEMVMVVNGVA